MKRPPVRAVLFAVLCVWVQGCGNSGGAPTLDCGEARRVTREALALMTTTARDESTKLQRLVQDGWQTPYDDLTIIRSVEIGECEAADGTATVAVVFDVLGGLLAAARPSASRSRPALGSIGVSCV